MKVVHEIRKLEVIERLNIITDIWDKIKEAKELETVSDDEERLLLNRLANYKAHPESAWDWETLKPHPF